MVADLSFISLRTVLAALLGVWPPSGGDLILLVSASSRRDGPRCHVAQGVVRGRIGASRCGLPSMTCSRPGDDHGVDGIYAARGAGSSWSCSSTPSRRGDAQVTASWSSPTRNEPSLELAAPPPTAVQALRDG